jgi:hypothetical protein
VFGAWMGWVWVAARSGVRPGAPVRACTHRPLAHRPLLTNTTCTCRLAFLKSNMQEVKATKTARHVLMHTK